MAWARKVALLLLVLASGAVVFAEPNDAASRARIYFETGHGLYTIGNYKDALQQLAAGYALLPKPQFLIDMAQCYRRLGDVPKYRELLQRYLAEAPHDASERAQVEALLAETDDVPKPVVQPAPTIPTPTPTPPTHRRRAWAPWLLAGIGGAGLIAGGTLGGLALHEHDASIHDPVSATTAHKQNDAEHLAIGSTVSLALGGVLAAAGLVWGVVDAVRHR